MGLGNIARNKLTQGANLTKKLAKRTIIKDVNKTVINPLGKELTTFSKLAVVGGVAAWGVAAGTITGRRKTLTDNAEYVGNVGAMDYDAVANVDRKTGQRNFGATGDLVFGLNNSRRG